ESAAGRDADAAEPRPPLYRWLRGALSRSGQGRRRGPAAVPARAGGRGSRQFPGRQPAPDRGGAAAAARSRLEVAGTAAGLIQVTQGRETAGALTRTGV